MALVNTLVAGTTLKHTFVNSEYPSSEYTLTLYLRGPQSITVTYESDQTLSVAYTTTLNWLPGKYSYSIYAQSLTDRQVVETGYITISPAVENIPVGVDNKTHNERVLESINAVIEKRATTDQMKYSINGRSLERMSIADLLLLRDYYYSRVQKDNGKTQKRVLAFFR